jgi:hypothetical protein
MRRFEALLRQQTETTGRPRGAAMCCRGKVHTKGFINYTASAPHASTRSRLCTECRHTVPVMYWHSTQNLLDDGTDTLGCENSNFPPFLEGPGLECCTSPNSVLYAQYTRLGFFKCCTSPNSVLYAQYTRLGFFKCCTSPNSVLHAQYTRLGFFKCCTSC